jgi:AraC-like DNA-binding protein
MYEFIINNDIYYFVIGWGAAQALVMAVAQIFFTGRKIENYILAVLLCCLALFQLHFVFMYKYPWIERDYPFIFFPHMAPIYLAGPLYYLYVQKLVIRQFKFKYRQGFHYMPAFAILVLEIAIQFLPIQNRNEILNQILRVSFYMHPTIYTFLKTAGLLFFMVYILIMIANILRYWHIQKMTYPVRMTFLFNVISVVTLLSFIIFFTLGDELLMNISFLMIPVMIIIIYLFGFKYPDFLSLLRKEVEKKRYERSMLRGINISSVMERLTSLMESEKIFCDEDISLNSVASELSITPHQLSEILNSNLNMSFYTFINKYRIAEAKKMMREEHDRSLLSIAFAVGYNNKATFYSAFMKFAGTTPHKFRKEHSDYTAS